MVSYNMFSRYNITKLIYSISCIALLVIILTVPYAHKDGKEIVLPKIFIIPHAAIYITFHKKFTGGLPVLKEENFLSTELIFRFIAVFIYFFVRRGFLPKILFVVSSLVFIGLAYLMLVLDNKLFEYETKTLEL